MTQSSQQVSTDTQLAERTAECTTYGHSLVQWKSIARWLCVNCGRTWASVEESKS